MKRNVSLIISALLVTALAMFPVGLKWAFADQHEGQSGGYGSGE
ncbi:hypothetical protein LCGC14_2343200, partial [marine sediment metagenome]